MRAPFLQVMSKLCGTAKTNNFLYIAEYLFTGIGFSSHKRSRTLPGLHSRGASLKHNKATRN